MCCLQFETFSSDLFRLVFDPPHEQPTLKMCIRIHLDIPHCPPPHSLQTASHHTTYRTTFCRMHPRPHSSRCTLSSGKTGEQQWRSIRQLIPMCEPSLRRLHHPHHLHPRLPLASIQWPPPRLSPSWHPHRATTFSQACLSIQEPAMSPHLMALPHHLQHLACLPTDTPTRPTSPPCTLPAKVWRCSPARHTTGDRAAAPEAECA